MKVAYVSVFFGKYENMVNIIYRVLVCFLRFMTYNSFITFGALVLLLFVVGFPRAAQADKQQLADDFYRLDNDIEIRIRMPETEWNALRGRKTRTVQA